MQGAFNLRPVPCGGNNRVFELHAGPEKLFLKSYFRHIKDTRDRLDAEFGFISFAWQQGIRLTPKPIAIDRDHHLGLYEFIEGDHLKPDDVNKDAIHQAIKFYRALNRNKNNSLALVLPHASEACFSIKAHVLLVDQRLKRLQKMNIDDAITKAALKFIHKELTPMWKKIKTTLLRRLSAKRLNKKQPLALAERCLSPSDFGFHNALCQDSGELRFIDFEYAGWDDPAKLVCDFFCQPAVPVPFKFFSTFQTAIASQFTEQKRVIDRINLLFPLYQLKWCCILLNEFLPGGKARRVFAGEQNHTIAQQKQLEKAHTLFLKIRTKE
ncbi:aminoglycoside phosphotransferase family protein [Desulfococcaceae bacterium HSG9]|nr:aminoglycoside phosphotransferase family protein [Desulfococcaceae bacterium HSG9]